MRKVVKRIKMYERMPQMNHTLIAMEEFRVTKREDKRVHKIKWKYNEGNL
jgi:ABC-type molybdenum transport system ATPase subunit/photorepair protein PhrA